MGWLVQGNFNKLNFYYKIIIISYFITIRRWFKIIRKQLYCYASETDPKAEIVYNLAECTISLKNEFDDASKEEKNMKHDKSTKNFISVDHTIQISCFLQGASDEETYLLLEEIKRCLNLTNSENY